METSRFDQRYFLLLLFAIPVSFFSGSQWLFGSRPSGWAWLTLLGLGAFATLARPLNRSAVRYLAPYLAFLVVGLISLIQAPDIERGFQNLLQMIVPALTYLIAWRIPDEVLSNRSIRSGLVASLWLAGGVMIFGSLSFPALVGSTRPVAISLVLLVILATYRDLPTAAALSIGMTGLAFAVFSGARMASVALALVLLIGPTLKLRGTRRILLGVALAACAVSAFYIPAVQERFFFGSQGSIYEAVTLSGNLDTSGRRELWQDLYRDCSESPILGLGFGASDTLSLESTGGLLNQPHNEYLRIYCDTGLIGLFVLLSFFVSVGYRAVRLLRQRGTQQRSARATLAVLLAIGLLAVTDNVLLYTAPFMAAATVILAWSDRVSSLGIASRAARRVGRR